MDASGRLESSLVLLLLQRGYFVHATLCNNHGNLQALKGLSCDNKNLRVFRADPFDYQSIVDALKGCSALFYSFEPQEDEPTFNVMWISRRRRLMKLRHCNYEVVRGSSVRTSQKMRHNSTNISNLKQNQASTTNPKSGGFEIK